MHISFPSLYLLIPVLYMLICCVMCVKRWIVCFGWWMFVIKRQHLNHESMGCEYVFKAYVVDMCPCLIVCMISLHMWLPPSMSAIDMRSRPNILVHMVHTNAKSCRCAMTHLNAKLCQILPRKWSKILPNFHYKSLARIMLFMPWYTWFETLSHFYRENKVKC